MTRYRRIDRDPDDMIVPTAPHIWLNLAIVTLAVFACIVVRFGLI